MKRLLFLLCGVFGFFICPAAMAQISCAQSSKLICLIPNELNLGAASVSGLQNAMKFLGEGIGGEISSLPLPSPASGVIYTIDPKLNVPVPSNETLGPILTQRSETIGGHKLYLAATYQFFRFEDIDGGSLKNIPIFISVKGSGSEATNNRLDLTVHQVVGYATYGLTSRVDVSVAVPILDVSEQFQTSAIEYLFSPPPGVQPVQAVHLPATTSSAAGIGDVVLAAKGTVWKPTRGGLAVGTEVRLPTGDAMNFLGSGTIGVKPFASWTLGGRISPHADVSYQMNGESILATNSSGAKGHLPNRLFYSGGVDARATKWVTIAGDVLAQRVFDPTRFTVTQVQAAPNVNLTYPTIPVNPVNTTYNRLDGSIGAKFKPFRNLIITGNLLVKLDQGGLRARTVPLAGLSYTF